MKKPLIQAGARPSLLPSARPLAGKISLLIWRMRALSRNKFDRNLTPGWQPRSRAGWLVIAVRGFARSYQRHPVKIRIGNRK